ncbi:hypothetical protein HF326_04630 [Bacillus altitudinis MN12]|uniref:Uncharacterized protein n=2 Tax=Bacillus TaxID=1386 RepID=A0ABV1S831_BACAB|nr:MULTISPECIES: hypothetical protein [Bacillus]EMI14631.1 hypothetical protein C883_3221 [Bacillus stratosphericus LAMA 585]KML16761.1 hypothetical protein VL09_10065 [Bacillus stratosphericus]MBR3208074.1 hypothetical protein [Bacillus sp. (in: firmicutes)]MDH8709661.1 Skp family chaperone for outer membrane proteins [Micromonospora sp. 1209]UJM28576.1 hypothetical protein L2D31_04680 [Bacillus aerophilus]BAT48026.1 uncharacterized protein BTUAT1_08920 [Bacillus pumilus]
MKTIAKSLMLSTTVLLFASPITQTADAASIQTKQVTAESDFQLPSTTDTIKQNIEQSFQKQEKWLQKLEVIAGQEKREQFEQFFNQHVGPDLKNLLEESDLTWKQVEKTIYQSLVKSDVPFLAAKSIAHFATVALKKM